jgi:hypothetical protein
MESFHSISLPNPTPPYTRNTCLPICRSILPDKPAHKTPSRLTTVPRVDYFNEINGQTYYPTHRWTLPTRFKTSSKWQSLSKHTATGMQMIERTSFPSFFHLLKSSYSRKTTLKKPRTFLLASSSGLAVAVVRSLGLSLSAGFVLWSSSKSFCQ